MQIHVLVNFLSNKKNYNPFEMAEDNRKTTNIKIVKAVLVKANETNIRGY